MFDNTFTMRAPQSALLLFLITPLLLGGCVTDMEQNPKQMLGKVLGAGLGALTGSQIGSEKGKLISVAVGTLAGAWLGGEVGKSLDKADQAYLERSTRESLEYSKNGTALSWNNPDSGNSGSVTPKQTFQRADGQFCREFEQTVNVAGKKDTAVGRACREPDGSWKIVS